MSWTPTPNARLLRCSECEITFPVGRHCGCPIGNPSSDQSEDSTEPSGSTVEGLPTAADYERELYAVRVAQRTARNRLRELRLDEHEYRVAALLLSQQVAISNHLDKERKALVSLLEAARKRELPEEVARLERLDRARNSKTQSRRAHGVEDHGN